MHQAHLLHSLPSTFGLGFYKQIYSSDPATRIVLFGNCPLISRRDAIAREEKQGMLIERMAGTFFHWEDSNLFWGKKSPKQNPAQTPHIQNIMRPRTTCYTCQLKT